MKKDVVKFVRQILKERSLKLKDLSDAELQKIMSLHSDFITHEEIQKAIKKLRKQKK